MNPKRNKPVPLISFSGLLILLMIGCGGTPQTTNQSAIEFLQSSIDPAVNATISTSTDIEWNVGVLRWDRFTLPVFSTNGLRVAVQHGPQQSRSTLSGANNKPVSLTSIELLLLDPIQGKQTSKFVSNQDGLLLSRVANDRVVFVESPRGEEGRWIGEVHWATGTVEWVVRNDAINAFPTTNVRGDLAWSTRSQGQNRFHLTIRSKDTDRIIDDQVSDWVFPYFVGNDRLRVFSIHRGQLSLVELDLTSTEPLRSAMSITLLEAEATRFIALQIATMNPLIHGQTSHAFYHPLYKRMAIWEPNLQSELRYFAAKSVAAAPVGDGTWIVSTDNRVLRQSVGESDGIHLRNQLAIPVATTSKQWTHLLLEPKGDRLRVHAVNLKR